MAYKKLFILLIVFFIGCGGGNNNNIQNKVTVSENLPYGDLNLSENYIWGKTIHTIDHSINDITTDKANNHYIIGYVENESFESFILKIDSDGNKLWEKTTNLSPMPWTFTAIRVDDQGFLYAAGEIKRETDNRAIDGYIIKFDQNGNKIWDRVFGGSKNESFFSIKIDGTSLYVGGYSQSYDGDIVTDNNGREDALVLKLDTDGNFLWHQTFGGTNMDKFIEVAIDAEHNIICVGHTSSKDRDITESTYGSDRDKDALIVKYTPAGNVVWHRIFGGSEPDEFNGVVTDKDANIYLAGITSSEDGSFPDVNTSYSYKDGFIMKIDKEGNEVWNHVIRKNGEEGFNRIYVDAYENYYAIGLTNSRKANNNHSTLDATLIKFTNTGKLETQYILQATSSILFNSITVGQNGYIYAAGEQYISQNRITNGIIVKISTKDFQQPMIIKKTYEIF